MSLKQGVSEAIEQGRQLRGYTECIDAVFAALQENLPEYLRFSGGDHAANLEAEIVWYLQKCEGRY